MIQELRHSEEENLTFDILFRRYYQALSYFAFSILGDRDLAEDVVQSVFVSVLNGEFLFEDDLHARNYLYKAVRNASINEIKRLNVREDLLSQFRDELEEDADLGQEPDILRSVVKSEIYREIMQAIESLPTESGKVFKMAYLENLSNQEIADLLSLSVNTVKVHKNNAKKRLRGILKDLYPLVFLIS